jgi:hypothetical protein
VKRSGSALRWYAEFADEVLGTNGDHLPPSPQGIAAWSLLFRRANTFANYIGYLKLGCEMLGLCTLSFDHPLVKRAKSALKKRQEPGRVKKFIQV